MTQATKPERWQVLLHALLSHIDKELQTQNMKPCQIKRYQSVTCYAYWLISYDGLIYLSGCFHVAKAIGNSLVFELYKRTGLNLIRTRLKISHQCLLDIIKKEREQRTDRLNEF